jgi:hypothetical protein
MIGRISSQNETKDLGLKDRAEHAAQLSLGNLEVLFGL